MIEKASKCFMPIIATLLPSQVSFHYYSLEAKTQTLPHSHTWGQLHLIKQGLLEMEVEQKKLISPASYAIWTPANKTHRAFNRTDIEYCAINICEKLSSKLPNQPCMIPLTPMLDAIISDFIERKITVIEAKEDRYLAYILIERLAQAAPITNYLPVSEHRLLKPILTALEQDPADNKSLCEWAKQVFTCERTLARRFRSELNMSFNDWRQRAKLVKALSLLKQAISINEIAFQLGYSQGSSFIKMFRKMTGVTPQQYREQIGQAAL
jgi:AraC-like DNA-binding protein